MFFVRLLNLRHTLDFKSTTSRMGTLYEYHVPVPHIRGEQQPLCLFGEIRWIEHTPRFRPQDLKLFRNTGSVELEIMFTWPMQTSNTPQTAVPSVDSFQTLSRLHQYQIALCCYQEWSVSEGPCTHGPQPLFLQLVWVRELDGSTQQSLRLMYSIDTRWSPVLRQVRRHQPQQDDLSFTVPGIYMMSSIWRRIRA